MGKVAKDKWKTRANKMQKTENVLKSKTTNRQAALKITIRGERIYFCIKAGTCINKRNLGFNFMYDNWRY